MNRNTGYQAMFRIGEFSIIAQVPGSVLRYYDQIGLLKPAHIDQFTGYRYYTANQLPRLHRILALKELGLTLEQVTQFIDDEVSSVEIRGMLTLRKAQVEQTVQEEIARLKQIEARLQFTEAPTRPAFDIVMKQVPTQQYLSLREVLPNVDAALGIMRELVRVLPTHLNSGTLGHFTTVVHSETLESNRLDIELGAILLSHDAPNITLAEDRQLRMSTLPAIDLMATIVQVGGFENNCRSYGAIGLWVEENGYGIAGPGREVLIKPPRTDQLDELVTEIQFPVQLRRN
jgi:DNA-binding transcriptional MerR regulator